MSEKKNIDRLFQEKFKDFEEAPPEFVWDNIREELQEKKKRRVVPLWIRLSGVAAALIIGIFFLQPYIPGSGSNPVVNGAEARPGDKVNPANNPVKAGQPVINDNKTIPGGANAPVIVYGDGKGKTGGAHKNAGADDNKSPGKKSTTATGSIISKPYKNNSVAHQQHDNARGVSTHSNKLHTTASGNGTIATNEAVASAGTAHKQGTTKGRATGKNNIRNISTGATDAPGTQMGTSVAQNRNNAASANKHTGVTQSNTITGAPGTHNNDGVARAGNTTNAHDKGIGNNNSITGNPENATPATGINNGLPVNEAVAEAITDTVKPAPENALEKLLREQQEAKKEDKDKALAENSNAGKWNVKPQLAPVFYNSLSSGSPIDGQFAGNAKNYDTNLSYGVGVNYAVTNKLSIRSGINTVNLNYATQGVEFYASLNGQTNNVAARAKGANIVVKDQGTQTNSAGLALFTDTMKQDTFSGSMLQKTGYVEVPVEMAYAVLNHKFGIDIIGGVSTLFLNQNNVSVISTQGLSTDVGQAQNLNNIHFSTNVGLGFKYRFFKSFQANFEPTFKYQVNAYSRDAGNFKPYFIGLYSGISFSF